MGSAAQADNGAAPGTYLLRLFVAGEEPNSRLARQNLERICRRHLAGRFRLEIVDVLSDYQEALRHEIFVTPALLGNGPGVEATVFGNLSDTEKVLTALKLDGGADEG